MANHETFKSAVILPGAQAVMTGVLSGLASGSIAALMDITAAGHVGLAVGSLAALISWQANSSRWQRRQDALAGVVEQVPYRPPEPVERVEVPSTGEPEHVVIDAVTPDAKEGEYLDLPVSKELLTVLAIGLVAGKPFSVSAWTGSGNPFTRNEFEALRAELLARGYARWRGGQPAAGAELTSKGLAVMRYFAGSPTPPPGYRAMQPQ